MIHDTQRISSAHTFSIAAFSPKKLNDTLRMIGSAFNTVAFASSVGTAIKLVNDGGSS